MNSELHTLFIKGDENSILELWESIKRFVEIKATDYNRPDYYDDMMQEAFIAMVEASEKYNYDMGKSFLGFYASYYLPKAFKRAVYGGLTKAAEKEPLNSSISLDMQLGEENGDTLSDTIEDPEGETPYCNFENADYWDSIRRIIDESINSIKTETVRNIIIYHFTHEGTLKEGYKALCYNDLNYSRYCTLYRQGLEQMRKYITFKISGKDKNAYGLSWLNRRSLSRGTGLQSYREHNFTSSTERLALFYLEKR